MKIKAGELIQAVEAASKMMQDRMPLRAASWLVLFIKRMEPAYQLVIERRNDLIRKYSEEGKNSVAPALIPKYLEEVEPLLKEEVEVDVIKVEMSIFDNVQISPSTLMSLDLFLTKE